MKILLKLPCYPLSWLFGLMVVLKNKVYDRGWFTVRRLTRPVISVGNLSMGGAGKSPVVCALLELLLAGGYRVAVLSRGYGRKAPKTSLRVEPDQDWQLAGDEPAMIAQRFPKVDVYVGSCRFQAAQLAKNKLPDVFLLDDGFQHRQLHRDLDIVLLDVQQGRPQWFPLRLFREKLHSLRRADLVLLTRTKGPEISAWKQRIRAVNAEVPIACPRFEAGQLRQLRTGKILHIKQLRAVRVAAYAGISRPNKFYALLRELGLDVVIEESLSDHQSLDETRLQLLLQRCRKAKLDYLITTEKDAVKLANPAGLDILLCSLSIKTVWEANTQIQALLAHLMEDT